MAKNKSTKSKSTPQPKRIAIIGRCAKTGRFMTTKKAKERKNTAIVETIKYYS